MKAGAPSWQLQEGVAPAAEGWGDHRKCCCGLFSVAVGVDRKIESSSSENKVTGEWAGASEQEPGGGEGAAGTCTGPWSRLQSPQEEGVASGFREGAGAASGGCQWDPGLLSACTVLQRCGSVLLLGFQLSPGFWGKGWISATWRASEPGVLMAFPGKTAQMELDGVQMYKNKIHTKSS